MPRQAESLEIDMDYSTIVGPPLTVSRVAIGTWAIGGWMWGGTDEVESISTIRAALDHGIDVIDTAPVYGFGRSEEIVGKAIAEGRLRDKVVIATKVGLEWKDGSIFRNASRDRIMREVEDSLRRLRTDYIDIYQVHWPDPLVPIEETAAAMQMLLNQGKIRAIGVSNFSLEQMRRFRSVAALHVLQSPIICSSARSRPSFCPIAARTASRRSAMARCVEVFYPEECVPIRPSPATTCGAATRNSSSRGSGNILRRCKDSTRSLRSISASTSLNWQSAGCSIKVSPRRFGGRVIPVNCSQSTR